MRFGSLAIAAALVAGCDAPQAALQSRNPAARIASARFNGAGSWMARDAASRDLLYVSDSRNVVYVYSYPAGKLVGVLKGFQSPAGLCSDPSGNVFVTNTNALDVLEYEHGGTTPIAELNDFGHYPFGCAVDPATENLAVANYASQLSLGPGSVSIFDGAKGVPHSYEDTNFGAYYFCGYDSKSNLFVDGENAGSTQTEFAEIPKGRSTFTEIALDRTIGYPGAVQWDGQYLAVGDTFADALYRFNISGSKGSSVGELVFKGDRANLIAQFWIQGSTIVLPYGTLSRSVRKIGFWRYPSGGAASKSLDVTRSTELVGATISLAKR